MKFVCPICQSPLTIDEKVWSCDGSLNTKSIKHPFDVARQGYVNLLPVQHKKSKNPGDSLESILARQRFLQAGFYQPLQKAVERLLEKFVRKQSLWLDIGCGEGYYCHNMASVESINKLIAIDISKPAVIELAKFAKQQKTLWSQDGTILPLVASASQLPFADGSIQGVSSIFSPILPEELARVLSKQGILLIAKPDEGHLASVRAGLFDEVREHHSEKFLEQLYDAGFELIHTEKVSNDLKLTPNQLADLLTMTPYSYRAKRQRRELMLEQSEMGFTSEARFVVYVLQKQ